MNNLKATNAKFRELPDVLRQLVTIRRKAKITQAQVAEAMGTTASAVARLESGGGKKKHSPSLKTLKCYASALGCDIKMEVVSLKDIEAEETN